MARMAMTTAWYAMSSGSRKYDGTVSTSTPAMAYCSVWMAPEPTPGSKSSSTQSFFAAAPDADPAGAGDPSPLIKIISIEKKKKKKKKEKPGGGGGARFPLFFPLFFNTHL